MAAFGFRLNHSLKTPEPGSLSCSVFYGSWGMFDDRHPPNIPHALPLSLAAPPNLLATGEPFTAFSRVARRVGATPCVASSVTCIWASSTSFHGLVVYVLLSSIVLTHGQLMTDVFTVKAAFVWAMWQMTPHRGDVKAGGAYIELGNGAAENSVRHTWEAVEPVTGRTEALGTLLWLDVCGSSAEGGGQPGKGTASFVPARVFLRGLNFIAENRLEHGKRVSVYTHKYIHVKMTKIKIYKYIDCTIYVYV